MSAFSGQLSHGHRPWRCVLIGSQSLLVECATMLMSRGHDIVAIVTQAAPIAAWARSRDIAVLPRIASIETLTPGTIDYLFSITNLHVLDAGILALPTGAAINFHDGPLPGYAGLNTPIWALLNGERRHGVTWHVMESRIDTGDILAARSFDIDPDETAYSLNTKCFAAAIDTFGDLIETLEGSTRPFLPAGLAERFYGREHRPPAAATICWRHSVDEITTLVRSLDHGGHANPLAAAKFRIGDEIVLVGAATAAADAGAIKGAEPGTITQLRDNVLRVATGSGDVVLTRLSDPNGTSVTIADLAARHDLSPGQRLPIDPEDRMVTLSALNAAMARQESWWRRRLAARDPLTLPRIGQDGATATPTPGILFADIPIAGDVSLAFVQAALIAFLGRINDRATFDIGYRDPVFAVRFADVEPWFAPILPLAVSIDYDQPLGDLSDRLTASISGLHHRVGFCTDLIARSPDLRGMSADLPITLLIVDHLDEATLPHGAELAIAIRADGGAVRWLGASSSGSEMLATLSRGFAVLLAAARIDPTRPVGTLPLLDDDERALVVDKGRGCALDADASCIHTMFVDQARRTPDAPAVTSRGVTLTYAELDRRSDTVAQQLRALGVAPGLLVGIHLARSVDLLVAVLAVLKAGGAFVPLDPAYPVERIAHMIRDSRMTLIVTQADLADRLPTSDAATVHMDASPSDTSDGPVPSSGSPTDLAYVIYTSGSTGLPKGVMVEHRNVSNFFAGMNRVVEPGGTWLAVTSLSFDISVLELCWTVTRGCHVVVATGEEMTGARPAVRPMQFSLFYFASADGGTAADQYRLLLDGARFADTHGFAAVWTPERHFHAFGGLYPNPSVTSAAIAAITTRVAIRGGSVVMPLHHPVRVAEEWSLIDNLSNGRVGIAFASGWQPNDFVLRPENFANKTAALMTGIDTVRGLWRGEKRSFPGPLGNPVEVAIYPRPVQRELPFWITSAGNPDTFAAAGTAGAFVLTHLLGQTTDELAAKLAHYRQAWRAAGHPGEGHVTLMLHSFVGDDPEAVRAAVRQPLIDYLRTSTNLVKEFAWSFPAFKRHPGMADAAASDLSTLDEEDMAGLLEFAFERYFATGGLFGTPAHCLAMVERVRAAGVDEIGCLIDFGIPAQMVLDHLPALDALRRLAGAHEHLADETLPGLMQCHGVTHLQCTPSMARMLASDDAARESLRGLQQMLVGGEAFPPELAADLTALVGGSVINMYGPTETTIWSACHVVDGEPGRIPLGRPLANQQVLILDSRGEPALPGFAGELVVGGAGVTRGYHDRPELTADRFVDHPLFGGGRAYRTGDLVRQRPDGTLEFLGRLDGQVKIRGHRIELGEIEAVLGRHARIERAIVVAREDVPGDQRLVAYYVASSGCDPAAAELRDHLAAHLPAVMVPAHLVALPALPRTPNGKVDRAALPPPGIVAVTGDQTPVAMPADGMEGDIAAVWREVLQLPMVGVRENFFDLGGHSLLAVQVHRRLREALGRPLPLTDVFRFPTIEALARHLAAPGGDEAAVRTGQGRADQRRAALQRRGMRVPAAVDA